MFQKPTFGANSSGFGSFNAGATTSSPFGGGFKSTTNSAFGAPPAFGAAAQPAAGGGLFGAPNTSSGVFGTTNTSGFGSGGSFGGFGASSSGGGLFGASQPAPLFGAQQQQPFQAKPAGFGFGGTSTSTAAATPGSTLFGAAPATGGMFGQQPAMGGTLFGNNTGGFGQQQTATGTAHAKYNPVVGTDVVVKSGTSQNINIKHHCITCMKEYENKSLEELRLEDYTAGRKGAQGGGVFGFSQPQQENKPLFGGSTFGAPATTSAGVFGGGALGASTTGFGNTSTFSFGGGAQNTTQTNSLFGASKPAFGATSTVGTGLFGATTTQAPTFGTTTSTFGGFGTNTATQPSTGLFGAKPATTGFGAPPSSGFGAFGAGGGLFGAKPNAPPPAFGQPAPAFGSLNTSGFGTTTSTSGGLFGANNTFGKPATQPTFGFNQPTLGGGLGTNTFQTKPAGPAFGSLGGGSLFQQPQQQNTFKTDGLGGGLGGGMFGNTSGLGGLGGLGTQQTFGTNTSFMGQSGLSAAPQNNVHEQILSLVARPYGDSPLFKDLVPDSTTAEDALKPTNPAAVAAVLANDANYRVGSSVSRLKVLPRAASHPQVNVTSATTAEEALKPTNPAAVAAVLANDANYRVGSSVSRLKVLPRAASHPQVNVTSATTAEEALKPTNPAAVAAVLANDANYRVGSSVSRLKVLPRAASHPQVNVTSATTAEEALKPTNPAAVAAVLANDANYRVGSSVSRLKVLPRAASHPQVNVTSATTAEEALKPTNPAAVAAVLANDANYRVGSSVSRLKVLPRAASHPQVNVTSATTAEEALKPTNPAAVAAVLANDANYRVGSSVSRLKVLPRAASHPQVNVTSATTAEEALKPTNPAAVAAVLANDANYRVGSSVSRLKVLPRAASHPQVNVTSATTAEEALKPTNPAAVAAVLANDANYRVGSSVSRLKVLPRAASHPQVNVTSATTAEEALKPTNPAAVAAVLANDANYRVGSSVSRLKVLPRAASHPQVNVTSATTAEEALKPTNPAAVAAVLANDANYRVGSSVSRLKVLPRAASHPQVNVTSATTAEEALKPTNPAAVAAVLANDANYRVGSSVSRLKVLPRAASHPQVNVTSATTAEEALKPTNPAAVAAVLANDANYRVGSSVSRLKVLPRAASHPQVNVTSATTAEEALKPTNPAAVAAVLANDANYRVGSSVSRLKVLPRAASHPQVNVTSATTAEEALKPTNPAAVAAVLANDANYRVGSSVSRLKVLPRAASHPQVNVTSATTAEEALKPTNPAAVAAVLANDANYRVGSSVSRLKVLPRAASHPQVNVTSATTAEEALKPTNPAAVAAVLANDANYRVGSSVSRLKVLPRAASHPQVNVTSATTAEEALKPTNPAAVAAVLANDANYRVGSSVSRLKVLPRAASHPQVNVTSATTAEEALKPTNPAAVAAVLANDANYRVGSSVSRLKVLPRAASHPQVNVTSATTAEEALKPTNPAAVAAVLANDANYRVGSSVSRLKVLPRAASHPQKSLFDGLEEYDASLEDQLTLKPSRKRLVLRPKNTHTPELETQNRSSDEQNHSRDVPTQTEKERTEVNSNGDPDGRRNLSNNNSEGLQTHRGPDLARGPRLDTPALENHRDVPTQTEKERTEVNSNGDPDGRRNLSNNNNIELSSEKHASWLSSPKAPWHDKEKQSEEEPTSRLYPDLDKELPAQFPERRSSWLTTKTLRKPPPSAAETSAEHSLRELGVRSERDKENIDSLSVSEEESMTREPPPAAPHPAGVKLTRPGYYTIPSLEEMVAYMRPDGSCVVPHLTIGRKNYGNVFYDCEVDVANLDLDALVHFLNKEVIVYPEDSDKPPVGQGLNRRAVVTLDRIWPRDKTEKTPITDPERLLTMDYEGKLRRVCDKHDTKFIEYRPQTGSWVFRVEHFSKYGLTDSDEEDDPTPTVLKRQLVNETLQKNAAPAQIPPVSAAPGLGGLGPGLGGLSSFAGPGLGGLGLSGPGLGGLGAPGLGDDSLYAMQHTSLDLLGQAGKAFDMDTTEENGEPQSLYDSTRGFGVKSPTAELARLENRQSHHVQLMKASIYADDMDMDDGTSTSTGDQQVPAPRSVFRLAPRDNLPPVVEETGALVHLPDISSGVDLPMRPLIVNPEKIVLKYHRKVLPFKLTIAGKLDAACIADLSVSRARHSRVGFGPGGAMVFASTYDALVDLPRAAQLSEIGKYVAGRAEDDWSEPVVARLAIGQTDTTTNFMTTLTKQMETLLEWSTSFPAEESAEEHCPRLTLKEAPRDRREALRALRERAGQDRDRKTKFGVSGAYCYEVWTLCEALWGADLDNGGVPGTDDLSVVNRHRELLRWLTEAVAAITDRELERPCKPEAEDETDGHSARVWTLLLGGRLLEACKVSRDHGDMHMASLIAQAAGDGVFRSLIARQLSQWRECGAESTVSAHRLASLQLLAGLESPRTKLMEGDWLQTLHATARYICAPVPSLEHVVRTYESFFVSEPEGAADLTAVLDDQAELKCPLPPYMGEYDVTVHDNGKQRRVLDLRYELIRARAFNHSPKLHPAAYTPDPTDYSLSFLLGVWFGSPSIESITGVAEQLEAAGAWHLAVQALAHHPNDAARGHLIRGVLSRHAPARADTPELRARLELVAALRVPRRWLLLAQAHRAKYEHLPAVEAEHLVGAEQWNAAHKVLLEELLPEAVLADDLRSIAPLLEQLNEAAERHEVSGWQHGGQALHHYIRVCDEIRSLVSCMDADRESVQTRLEALRPRVAAACRAQAGLTVKTPRHAAARAEMGARLLQLAVAAREPPQHLAALLAALPLPPDCTATARQKITMELAEQASEMCIESSDTSPHRPTIQA
ncbi:nuclear pore complex protein Nup98-Nup96-like [Cydia splendana]|uniref:nuclear pore complex protein Nup98-Nup96-like n=1 Tax=Cydia splendana TaxID=1100963 RepID=UPI00300CD626